MSDLERKLLGDWGFELSAEEMSVVSGGYGMIMQYGKPVYEDNGSGRVLYSGPQGYYYDYWHGYGGPV